MPNLDWLTENKAFVERVLRLEGMEVRRGEEVQALHDQVASLKDRDASLSARYVELSSRNETLEARYGLLEQHFTKMEQLVTKLDEQQRATAYRHVEASFALGNFARAASRSASLVSGRKGTTWVASGSD